MLTSESNLHPPVPKFGERCERRSAEPPGNNVASDDKITAASLFYELHLQKLGDRFQISDKNKEFCSKKRSRTQTLSTVLTQCEKRNPNQLH